MAERHVVVGSTVGLHARPAALFTQAAARQPVPVTIARPGGDPVDARSILIVLTLGVAHGDTVVHRRRRGRRRRRPRRARHPARQQPRRGRADAMGAVLQGLGVSPGTVDRAGRPARPTAAPAGRRAGREPTRPPSWPGCRRRWPRSPTCSRRGPSAASGAAADVLRRHRADGPRPRADQRGQGAAGRRPADRARAGRRDRGLLRRAGRGRRLPGRAGRRPARRPRPGARRCCSTCRCRASRTRGTRSSSSGGTSRPPTPPRSTRPRCSP